MEPDVLHNEILRNSPALHSLSRQQLQKLCKTHSIKGTGKTTELIEKLKQLGEEERTQLVVEDANDEHDQVAPRPSQQWEIVPMDTIDEDEERSQASTLQSLRGQSSGEHGSSKLSLSSSLRALATSIGGAKRNEMDTTATTVASCVETLSDFPIPPSTLSSTIVISSDAEINAPLPGSDLIPGVPAPRPSLASVTTPTTIRLVSTTSMLNNPETPKLAPFRPAFEITAATPRQNMAHKQSYWMATPAVSRTYYTPSLDQGKSSTSASTYVFGTPARPEHSNATFSDAAASVLAEMNSRLEAAGVQTVSTNIFKQSPDLVVSTEATEAAKLQQNKKRRFSNIHEKEFDKMEGIGETLTRKEKYNLTNSDRRPRRPSKTSGLAAKKRLSSDGRRQTSLVIKNRVNAARQVSSASETVLPTPEVRPKKHTGAFEEVDEHESLLRVKRPRINLDDTAQQKDEAVFVSVSPHQQETRKLAQERDVLQKKLQDRKRRRSSIMRAQPPKAHWGLLASAKNLFQGVWRGGSAQATLSRPAIARPRLSLLERHAVAAKAAKANMKADATANTQGRRVGSESSSLLQVKAGPPYSRSPIPLFDATMSNRQTPLGPSSIGMAQPSARTAQRATSTSSARTANSKKTRSSAVQFKKPRVSSMGIASPNRTPSSTHRSSVNSRLTAPTASSLAKHSRNLSSATLTSSSSLNAQGSSKSRQTRHVTQHIFSEPLIGIGSPSRAVLPDENKSIGMAASTIPIHTTRPLILNTPALEKTTKPFDLPASSSKPIPGRRPRISRSKVIAKLASQRAGAVTGSSKITGKTRSSVGGLRRPSHGNEPVSLALKKRARQSEYARRQSIVKLAL